MFKSLKNIDSAFRFTRLIAMIAVGGAFLFSSFITLLSYTSLRRNEKQIYVIANGKVFEAFAEERNKQWPIEIEDHVKMFHHYFFTLTADDSRNRKSIDKALALAGTSAADEYNNLRESGYYSALIAASITQEIDMVRCEIDMNSQPWHFRYYGTITITRATKVVTRSLISEGSIIQTKPSSNNNHGLSIENWRVIENKDIENR